MQLKLNFYQHKIDCYIYKMYYVSLMVTTKQKSIVDTQKIKRREPRHINMEYHQVPKEEWQEKKKGRKELQNSQKTLRCH